MTEEHKVDVLICGGGSAGLCAAVWLSRCGISYKILERRDGPLTMGQADGVQCRTVEVFESFDMSEDLLREAYHVIELAFWAPAAAADTAGEKKTGGEGAKVNGKAAAASSPGIRRTHYAADVEPGISHQPHVILNQARMNALLTAEMERASGSSDILYGYEVKGVEVDSATSSDLDAYCCTVTTLKADKEYKFRAKYVLVRAPAPVHVSRAYINTELSRAATGPIARSASRWGSRWSATAPTRSGASWTCTRRPTSPTYARRRPSARTRAT